MSRFTQAVDEKFEFDGDEVCFTMRRMQNKHMLKLAPTAIGMPSENRIARTARLIDEAKDILRECVTNFHGLKDADGKEISFEMVLEESYFLALLDGMLGRLWEISILKEVDAKKSEGTPPAVLSAESVSPEMLPES